MDKKKMPRCCVPLFDDLVVLCGRRLLGCMDLRKNTPVWVAPAPPRRGDAVVFDPRTRLLHVADGLGTRTFDALTGQRYPDYDDCGVPVRVRGMAFLDAEYRRLVVAESPRKLVVRVHRLGTLFRELSRTLAPEYAIRPRTLTSVHGHTAVCALSATPPWRVLRFDAVPVPAGMAPDCLSREVRELLLDQAHGRPTSVATGPDDRVQVLYRPGFVVWSGGEFRVVH